MQQQRMPPEALLQFRRYSELQASRRRFATWRGCWATARPSTSNRRIGQPARPVISHFAATGGTRSTRHGGWSRADGSGCKWRWTAPWRCPSVTPRPVETSTSWTAVSLVTGPPARCSMIRRVLDDSPSPPSGRGRTSGHPPRRRPAPARRRRLGGEIDQGVVVANPAVRVVLDRIDRGDHVARLTMSPVSSKTSRRAASARNSPKLLRAAGQAPAALARRAAHAAPEVPGRGARRRCRRQ